MHSNNILEMQNAIKTWVINHMPKDKNKSVTGIVQGGRVIVGHQSYSYVPVADIYFGEGDRVVCLLPDSGQTAVVVGKI